MGNDYSWLTSPLRSQGREPLCYLRNGGRGSSTPALIATTVQQPAPTPTPGAPPASSPSPGPAHYPDAGYPRAASAGASPQALPIPVLPVSALPIPGLPTAGTSSSTPLTEEICSISLLGVRVCTIVPLG